MSPARVPCHPMAHAGLAIVDDRPLSTTADPVTPERLDLVMARAARLVHAHDISAAVGLRRE